MIINSTFSTCMLSFLLLCSDLNAEVILHGTRVIYPAEAREVTLQLSNIGEVPSLVQAWIDDGDPKSTPDQSTAPFMISPPISRVNAKKGQALRITALPNAASLSKTQETLFWLNVLDIPPKPESNAVNVDAPDNYLQLAIRSRIKLFYRPKGLEQAALAPEKIQWVRDGSQLKIQNPTAFYITLTSIQQEQSGKTLNLISDGLMLKPHTEEILNLQHLENRKMIFTTINDYGGHSEYELKLKSVI
ncbi:fimbrial biogenesis chaperone [Acinetobacter pullicarnis]|uniref:fimbrial biogenesis chaperone n=1 Tax=Acinetobacter pullicarnis TaxID=2576829 RepID=UPI00111EA735|nr:fimbria/pilus periplasmic chaperone [Acinetobacter pullicarnis]